MELNLAETGLALKGYLHDPSLELLSRLHESAKDFEHYHARYREVSTTDEARQLGVRVEQAYSEYLALAKDLIRLDDEQRRILTRHFQHEKKLNSLLEQRVNALDRSRPAELESLLGMDINVHRVSASLTNFLRDNSVAHENSIYEGLRDFSEFLRRFRGASSKDAGWAKETQRAFDGAVDLIYQIVEQEKRKQDGLKKTVELRLSIDKVLDEEIEKDIQDRLVKTKQGLLDVGEQGVAFVFSLLGIAVVVSVIAVLVTTRSISWPMQRLKNAIDRLGQGDLSRRIEVSADHEVGHLALAFNRMAEDLQHNTVSRTYVEGIFRAMSESLIVVSPDGLIETVNPAACNLVGYEEAELVGTRFENVCRAWSEMADRVRRGGAREYEVSYLTRDGRDVPVLCTANAMHAAAGSSDALDATVIVAIDITERKQAEQELTESQMRLCELAHHLNASIEADRTRIAREIHDQLGQALTGLKLDALSLQHALRDRFEDMEPSLLNAIENMIQMINGTIQTARRAATELRPAALDDLGLGPALDTLGEQFQERSGIECETSFPELIPLSGPQATALYRIAQEGLTNVARHSGAKKVWLRLRAEQNAVVLDISDNGRGISLEQISARQSLGLLGMQERARELGGTVTIDGKPGEGTLVQVRIPMATEQALRGSTGEDSAGSPE